MRLDTFNDNDARRIEVAYWGPGATQQAPDGERWRAAWFVLIGLWLGALMQLVTIIFKVVSAPFRKAKEEAA